MDSSVSSWWVVGCSRTVCHRAAANAATVSSKPAVRLRRPFHLGDQIMGELLHDGPVQIFLRAEGVVHRCLSHAQLGRDGAGASGSHALPRHEVDGGLDQLRAALCRGNVSHGGIITT